MKKILITGGSGFLGINMVRHCFAHGFTDVTVLDLAPFDYPERDRIDGKFYDDLDLSPGNRKY